MNSSQLTLTSGDSVITFNLLASTEKAPKAALDRHYWWYGSNALLSTQGGYSGRLLNGNTVLRNREGDLLEQGLHTKGLRTGEWRSWHPRGTIKGVYPWRKGQLHGRFEEFHTTGALRREGRYKSGKLKGKVLEYDLNGERTITRYRDGKEVVPKPKKEAKRFEKARKAWQKAQERAKKLNPIKRKNNTPATDADQLPEENRKQKKVKKSEQPDEVQQESGRRLFRKNNKVTDVPQG